MDALTLTAACILCATQPSVPANITRWEPLIAEASARFAIPEAWIEGVMHAESGGSTTLDGKPITSSAGAMGLMQIMPDTYTALQKQYGFGGDPYDPHDNIFAGAAYLHAMYERYGYPFMFAAYNAGPARFDDFLLYGQALPHSTFAYVNRIIPGGISAVETPETNQKSSIPSTKNHSAKDLFFALSGTSQSQEATATSDNVRRVGAASSLLVTTQRPSALFISPTASSP
ncbi:MAG TPA: lytic transglycosylase domain-containing protein [Rhizomicrobium sp.]|nr:lytic transglycosylase domain-containing protein [Rhizomicrobium sp.]